jgi:hypothetical protein
VATVPEFVRDLLETGALGQRVAAGRLADHTAALGFHDIEAASRFAVPAGPHTLRLTFFGRDLLRDAFCDAEGFYDFAKLNRLHLGGATVVVNQVYGFSGPVNRIKVDLERLLRRTVGVNCYATPANAQGFARHVDSHDVIVMQLQGRKHWELFDRAPRAEDRYTMEGFEPSTPPEQRLLSPGDVLYIPAGFVHAAKSGRKESSLHITIGFSSSEAADAPASIARGPKDASSAGEMPFGAMTHGSRLRKREPLPAERFAGALWLRAPDGRHVTLRRECWDAWSEIDRRGRFTPEDLRGRVPDGRELLFCYYLLNNGIVTGRD